MARYAQPTFAAGEIDPSLHGRVDLARYLTGLSLCRNMFVRVFGGVRKRPGTRYVASLPGFGRAIPFEFSTTDTYALIFTDLEMRVVRNGGLVVDPGTLATVAIASPYAAADLRGLKFNQSGNVLTIVHPSYPAYELTRQDHHLWTFAQKTYSPALPAPAISGVTATRTWDLASPNRTYSYKVTAVGDDGEESLPSAADDVTAAGKTGSANFNTTSPADVLEKRNFNTITWGAVAGAAEYNVYLRRNGLYGFIGSTEALTFDDDGINPDLGDPPPSAREPFSGGKHPGAVGRFEQRIFLGGSDVEPETYHASRTGLYDNFGRSDPLQDDDGITATLTGDRVNRIYHFVTLARRLLILTKGAEWVLDRGDTGLTPALEGGQAEESYHGSSEVRPLRIGDAVLWVRDGGDAVMEGVYDLAGGLISSEASLLSGHMFEGVGVVDICFAKLPYKLVWVVLSDGSMLSLSYLREQEVFGWAKHSTDGQWQSCCAVREGARDVTYTVVLRAGVYMVERIDTVDESDPRDAFYVDSGLTYDQPVTISGISVDGLAVKITAPGHDLFVGAQLDVDGVVGNIEFDEAGLPKATLASILNGRRFRAVAVVGDVVTIGPEYEPPEGEDDFIDGSGLAGASGGTVRRPVSIVTGLGHLEGRAVAVLADGGERADHVVVDGSINVGRAAGRVHVGLPFTSELETLALPGDAEVSGRRKRVTEIRARIRRTRGLKAGPNPAHLNELATRREENWSDPTFLRTQQYDLTIRPTWSRDGKVYILHDSPLPFELLSMSPVFEVGGG